MELLLIIPFGVVSVVSLIACATDLKSFRIPNSITVPLAVSGIAFHSVVYGLAGLRNSLLGMLFGGFVLLLLYLVGGMGAGDVKLLAAVGAWLGIPAIVYVFVIAAIVGSVYSFALLFAQGRLRSAVTIVRVVFCQLIVAGKHLGADEQVESLVKQEDSRRRLVPFAVMIAIGVIFVMIGAYLV